jgi:hypothetical protein
MNKHASPENLNDYSYIYTNNSINIYIYGIKTLKLINLSKINQLYYEK